MADDLSERYGDVLVLADTLSAHDPAAFVVHVPAGLGGDGVRVAGSGVLARVGSGLAEERGERGDQFLQQRVGAGLLVSQMPGVVVGDGAAVLGLAGELADAGGHGRVDGGRPARAGAASRG